MKLIFSSIFTLGLLSSFVFFIVTLILLQSDVFTPTIAIIATIVVNIILWLVSPWITDHFNRWFYKTKYLSKNEVEEKYPDVAKIVTEVSSHYNFPFPKIGIIPDKNPTAFTYGSARYNSRIVLTEGIFHFLNPQEIRAVVAHELGHIVNRDFIVMMIASTLLQILYIIYDIFRRAKGKKSGGLRLIALIAYVFYIIGTYLVLYLSRVRELMADEFSTRVSSPSALGNALTKIAYGIVSEDDRESTKKLLQSTRHMGIMDVQNAKHVGASMYIANKDTSVLAEVMVFDIVSPWAKLIELTSTHPLTGKRLNILGKFAKKKGEVYDFNLDAVIPRMNINKTKLYGGFIRDVGVYLLPAIVIIISFIFPVSFDVLLLFIGLSLVVRILYKYPQFVTVKVTTILDEMRDPYASPMRGRQVRLSGSVMGRGVPGYIFGEDMMYQDKTGITYLNYNSLFGFVGNLFFALGKLKTLLGVQSHAEGWFFRSMSSSIALKHLTTDTKTLRSHPVFWSMLLPLAIILFALWGMGTARESAYSPKSLWDAYMTYSRKVSYAEDGVSGGVYFSTGSLRAERANIKVWLINSGGEKVCDTVTDDEGIYYCDVRSGVYTIESEEIPGYQRSTPFSIDYDGGKHSASIEYISTETPKEGRIINGIRGNVVINTHGQENIFIGHKFWVTDVNGVKICEVHTDESGSFECPIHTRGEYLVHTVAPTGMNMNFPIPLRIGVTETEDMSGSIKFVFTVMTSPTPTPAPITLAPGRANCTYAPSLPSGDLCEGYRTVLSNPTEGECNDKFDCERLKNRGVSRACYTRQQCIQSANEINQ